MKILLIGVMSITMFSCGKHNEMVTIISENEAPQLFTLADSVAKTLVKKLGGRLTEAIQEDGVIDAIDVCHKDAYKITDKLVDQIDEVASIKRVTNKYRNPKNAPDKYEIEALAWFKTQIETDGTMPKSLGQKIVSSKKEIIRYYKPMLMQNKCLLCHGDDETRLPEVSKRILKHYPVDKAVNYQESDFRGLIRVEMQGKQI